MTLKSLIQRLLDSRTTPSEAAHSAMPSSSYVTVTATAIQEWGEMAKGVATFDGFVRVSARATSSNANVRVTNDTAAMFSQTEATASGQTQGVFVPVAKGDSWSVFGTNRDNPVVRVVKAIGGGYNIFVRRALSCLRPSFNFSLKNSLLAEATGFPTNPIQLFKRRISHLQRQESGFLSSLLATGGSASKGLPRKFCLATGMFGRGAIQQRHLIKAFVFLSQKAGLWPTYYRQTPRAHMSSLFRVSAINSFQTGGALC